MTVAEKLHIFNLIENKFPNIKWLMRADSKEKTRAMFVANSSMADARIYCYDDDAKETWDAQADGLYQKVWYAPRFPVREVDFDLIK